MLKIQFKLNFFFCFVLHFLRYFRLNRWQILCGADPEVTKKFLRGSKQNRSSRRVHTAGFLYQSVLHQTIQRMVGNLRRGSSQSPDV